MLQKKMVSNSILIPFAQQGGSCAPAAAWIEPRGHHRRPCSGGRWVEKEVVVVEAADPAHPRQPHPPHA
jgi:hypothetical protein